MEPSSKLSVEELAKLKQNPVSGLRQVLVTANATSHVPGTEDRDSVYSLQVVWPFGLSENWRVITYTIIPYLDMPVQQSGDALSGLGNTLLNFYLSPKQAVGDFVWGVGPAVLLPTRAKADLGSDRVGLGPSAVLYTAKEAWSAGVVLQNVWSLGGSGENKVNEFGAQYIFNYNFPAGWYLYSNQTIVADWTAGSGERWTVPVGVGLGRIFNIGPQPVSASLQAYANVARPEGSPKRGLNFQFAFLFP